MIPCQNILKYLGLWKVISLQLLFASTYHEKCIQYDTTTPYISSPTVIFLALFNLNKEK